jgi:transposase
MPPRRSRTILKTSLRIVHHHITNAVVEGLNNKIEKVKRTAYGFRNRDHYETMIYFHCGGLDVLPKPPKKCQIKWAPA